MILPAYPVLDFSGGVRRDLGALEVQRNQLLDARNAHLYSRGRVIGRRGSHKIGSTLSTRIEDIFAFVRYNTSGVANSWVFVNTNGTTAVLSTLTSTKLTSGITTASTTASVTSTTNTPVDFAVSGVVEIEGDLISYTGNSGTSFTGLTGIRVSHDAGASVNQWTTMAQSGTAVDGRMGITYAVLNNILFIVGRGANFKQFDGSSVSDVSWEPAGLFVTNYRDRLYAAGDGSSGTNGSSRRVSFSARGDGTSWTTASDFFDMEDQLGQPITGFLVHSDRLGIFKTQSTFVYNEVELKETIKGVGAYNHKVAVPVNGSIYTFCPNGIFETNLSSATQIGGPVRDFWENFMPTYDSVSKRVCMNTYAWSHRDSYFLYIGDITSPTSTDDVVLEFDTIRRNWTVHDGGFTDFVNATELKHFRYGDNTLTSSPTVFASDISGQIFRMNDTRYVDTDGTKRGSDILTDEIADSAGNPIPIVLETKLHDLEQPGLWKVFDRIRVFSENSQWSVQYRVENEDGITDYKPLGTVSRSNQTLLFPKDAAGWRIGFKVTCINGAGVPVFNGFVLENTDMKERV